MLAKIHRWIAVGGVCVLSGLSWGYLAWMPDGMHGSFGPRASSLGVMMPSNAWSTGEIAWTFIMWLAMMAAMMLPSAVPAVLTFVTASQRGAAARKPEIVTAALVLGYLAAWIAFSVAATLAQGVLHAGGLLSIEMRTPSALLSGGILVAAGAFQLTPLKRACLRKCRTPMGFILAEWRDGAGGAAIMGLRYGLYCVGCCWALMAVLFVAGVMNVLWVAGIAALVLLEKVVPFGEALARVSGICLMLLGIWFIAD